MTQLPTVWIVHSIGTREARDLRAAREKDGRVQRRVQILGNKGAPETSGKGRWIDAALVYQTEAEAKAALHFARLHRDRHKINQTLGDILVSIDFVASLSLTADQAALERRRAVEAVRS
jgi:hypothetical protein